MKYSCVYHEAFRFYSKNIKGMSNQMQWKGILFWPGGGGQIAYCAYSIFTLLKISANVHHVGTNQNVYIKNRTYRYG